ncbi:VOC family protein [Deinococcus irradiatisoli]|nr:VOC family protein [Deinococcus irradiatisoli]
MPYAAGHPSWTDLATPSPDQSRAFYAALFGWEYSVAPEEYGNYATALRGGPGQSAAGIAPLPGDSDMPSAWTTYFASDDVYADAERVTGLGGQVVMAPLAVGDLGHMGLFTDPSGAAFGLWQAGRHTGAEVMGEVGSLAWLSLNTRDSAAALAFYRALLGAQSEVMTADYQVLKHGDQTFAGVYSVRPGADPPTPGWMENAPAQWVTYFMVDDTEQAAETTVRYGGRVLEAPYATPYGRMAVLADPSGAVFAVVDRPLG